MNRMKYSAGRLMPLLLILLAGAFWPAIASAQEEEVMEGDLTFSAGNHSIDANTTVKGDVVLLGGSLAIDGNVEGDVVVFGGKADVNGEVDGDLVLFGGTLNVDEQADFDGDCVVIGGNYNGGSQGSCTSVIPSELLLELPNELGLDLGSWVVAPPSIVEGIDDPVLTAPHDGGPGFFGGFFLALLQAAVFGGIAFMVATIVPHRLTEVSEAVQKKTGTATVVGGLTFVATLSLITVTAIIWVPVLAILTLICGLGLILFAAGMLFLGGTAFMGWTAVGALVGERIARTFSIDEPAYPALAAVGTAIMTFGVAMLNTIPFVPYLLVGFIILSIGLGGVVLTRIGRQPYPRLEFTVDPGKVQDAVNNMP